MDVESATNAICSVGRRADGWRVGGLEGWRVGCLKAEDGRLKTEAMRGRADARMRSKAEDGRADGWKV